MRWNWQEQDISGVFDWHCNSGEGEKQPSIEDGDDMWEWAVPVICHDNNAPLKVIQEHDGEFVSTNCLTTQLEKQIK